MLSEINKLEDEHWLKINLIEIFESRIKAGDKRFYDAIKWSGGGLKEKLKESIDSFQEGQKTSGETEPDDAPF